MSAESVAPPTGRELFTQKWGGFIALFEAAGVKVPADAHNAAFAYEAALTVWTAWDEQDRVAARAMKPTRENIDGFVSGTPLHPYARTFMAKATAEQFAKFVLYSKYFAMTLDL